MKPRRKVLGPAACPTVQCPKPSFYSIPTSSPSSQNHIDQEYRRNDHGGTKHTEVVSMVPSEDMPHWLMMYGCNAATKRLDTAWRFRQWFEGGGAGIAGVCSVWRRAALAWSVGVRYEEECRSRAKTFHLEWIGGDAIVDLIVAPSRVRRW